MGLDIDPRATNLSRPLLEEIVRIGEAEWPATGLTAADVARVRAASLVAARKESAVRNLISACYPDAEAEALVSSIAPPTSAGKTNYRVIIAALKQLGLWGALSNGFLFGSAHQPSSTTAKSIKGGNDATGTGTQGAYHHTLNGTSDKFSYSATAVASVTAKTIVAVFSDSNVSAGHVSHVWSAYAGGAAKGPAIYSGGSSTSGSGSGTIPKVYGFGSLDGTATTEAVVDTATYGAPVFAAMRQGDSRLTLHVHGKDRTNVALASHWSNSTARCIGANGAGTSAWLAGNVYAVLEFDAALTDAQIQSVLLVLRYVFGLAVGASRFVAFEGNSLTATASGGGTTWPTKLLSKSEWSSVFTPAQVQNVAAGGTYESQYGEQTYYLRTSAWSPVVGERNILFVWGGINDLTAGIPARQVIAALDRHLRAAWLDGWEIKVLPLTPVANAGQGMAYGYSAAQQQALADVNAWIEGVGAPLYGEFIDVRKIGATNPTFLDPTSSDYYVAGDGLHHNDAGRALIADYVDAQVFAA